MTHTRIETVALTDGTELLLTVAEPENVVRGGLVVLHEARGVTDRVRSLVSAFAEQGWLTVAPHLYHRHGVGEFDAQAQDEVRPVSSDSVLADTDAAFLWLTEHEAARERQGVIGLDLGGTAALVVAASRSVGAAVTVGGRGILQPLSEDLPALVDIAGELSCPWLGIYGERDGDVPGEQIDKLREAAEAAEVATDVVRYPDADHLFESDRQAAHEAWQRAQNWLDLHMR